MPHNTYIVLCRQVSKMGNRGFLKAGDDGGGGTRVGAAQGDGRLQRHLPVFHSKGEAIESVARMENGSRK